MIWMHMNKIESAPVLQINRSEAAKVAAYKFGTVLLSGGALLSKERLRKRDLSKFGEYYTVTSGKINDYGLIILFSKNADLLLLNDSAV